MTTHWECDWCNEMFHERTEVSLVDFDGRSEHSRIHICWDCLPDGVESMLDIQERAA